MDKTFISSVTITEVWGGQATEYVVIRLDTPDEIGVIHEGRQMTISRGAWGGIKEAVNKFFDDMDQEALAESNHKEWLENEETKQQTLLEKLEADEEIKRQAREQVNQRRRMDEVLRGGKLFDSDLGALQGNDTGISANGPTSIDEYNDKFDS